MAGTNTNAPGRSSVSLSNARIHFGKLALAALLFLSSFTVTAAGAQSIRGTVVDANSREPVDEATVVLLSANGKDTVASPVRTNAMGQFVLYARESGPYRVSAVRLGFKPVVGEPIAMKDDEVAMLEVDMSSLPNELSTVAVKARRTFTASELMSTVGFDLRSTQVKTGHFIGRDELAKYGQAPLDNVIRDNAIRLSLDFAQDSFMNDVMIMRSGVSYCLPEVRLDGNLVANSQGGAAQRLRTYRANQIYGVEVYRGTQLPPPRLAADLGTAAARCGAVAIWTRAYGNQISLSLFTSFSGAR